MTDEPEFRNGLGGASAGPEGSGQDPEQDREELLRLASVVAHQLRSPLNAVQTVLGSVLGGFAGPLDARQRWLLEKAWQRCSAGIELVRDMLKLRSLEQLDEGDLGPVDMASVLSSTVAAFQEAARLKRLDLVADLDRAEAGRAWVRAEPTLVRELLAVLLDNAIKYTPAGGTVTVRLFAEASSVCVEVVDTGIGIPPEGYQRLFTEFYRAPNAKQMAAEGTGLGLAFARRAVRRLGGSLTVEPAEGGGTRAAVCLPERPEYAGEPESGMADGPRLPEREPSRRVVVIGGVAAGSKAAAKIMRLDPDADVTIVERGRFLAYAGCGLPYYISGAVSEQKALLETPLGAVRDPMFFHDLKNVRAHDLTEALAIDREAKRVRIRRLLSGEETELPYDQLVLATGARPVIPDLPGVDLDGIYTLHGVEDAEAIRSRLGVPDVKDVVIVGGGLLGCQITEAVALRGARITLVEADHRLLRLLDPEFSALVRRYLEAHGVRVITGKAAAAFEGGPSVERVVLSDGTEVPCDFVLLTAGLEPEVTLAREAGLEIGSTGAVKVDGTLRTSDPSIFAVGDCAETVSVVSGLPAWLPGAAAATLQGRVAAVNVCGGEEVYPGVAGTTIVKVFDGTAACTGLTEEAAREAGFDPVCAIVPGPDRAHFVPTARPIVLKLVVDRPTGRVLGAQGVGVGEVAKRIDIVATAIMGGMDVEALAHLHLAYAPPFSMALDNVIVAANVVRNKLAGVFRGISPLELWDAMRSGDPPFLLDVRLPSEYGRRRLKGSRHIPLGTLRGRLHDLPRDRSIVVVCSLGLRSYEASLVLAHHGFDDVRVLDGGLEAWPFAQERLI